MAHQQISTYQQAIDYLYANLPIFQRVGSAAYKPDLTNTWSLCLALHNPQHKFKSIHIAGTNGKGSSSHMIASVLQAAGYTVGLYTSPHLKKFTERIRVNGNEVEPAYVIDFVNRMQATIEAVKPSFFEITVAMAFDYFAQSKVDVAVIEVGLGGRLDSTNVITPVLSLITNIGWDHTDLLGDTLQKIAFEKAGIIKRNVPVVISERQPDVEQVFLDKAQLENAPIFFASDEYTVQQHNTHTQAPVYDAWQHNTQVFRNLYLPLQGAYQQKNIAGVLKTIDILNDLGFSITATQLISGLTNVISQTHLRGRWQKLGEHPLIICDTGHNVDGIKEIVSQIARQQYNNLHMVIGMVKDKDITTVLSLLPKTATYYFCQAKIPRALNATQLAEKAKEFGLYGTVIHNVNEAIQKAKEKATTHDFIFIGGSTFVVAEIENL